MSLLTRSEQEKIIESASVEHRNKMRRALYELIWNEAHQAHDGIRARPMPDLHDVEIHKRLKELFR